MRRERAQLFSRLFYLLLRAPAVGNVPATGQQLDQVSIGVEDAAVRPLLPPLPAGSDGKMFFSVLGRVRRQTGILTLNVLEKLRRDESKEACSNALLLRDTEIVAVALVDERSRAIGKPLYYELSLVLDNQAITLLAPPQQLLCLLALGDIECVHNYRVLALKFNCAH